MDFLVGPSYFIDILLPARQPQHAWLLSRRGYMLPYRAGILKDSVSEIDIADLNCYCLKRSDTGWGDIAAAATESWNKVDSYPSKKKQRKSWLTGRRECIFFIKLTEKKPYPDKVVPICQTRHLIDL